VNNPIKSSSPQRHIKKQWITEETPFTNFVNGVREISLFLTLCPCASVVNEMRFLGLRLLTKQVEIDSNKKAEHDARLFY